MRFKVVYGVLSVLLITGCATNNNKVDDNLSITQARVFEHIDNKGCSLSEAAEVESLGGAIAAALVPKLIGSGIDALSSALKSASREDKKSLDIISPEIGVKLYKLTTGTSGIKPVGERRCLRLLVAEYPMRPFATASLTKFPAINQNTLISNDVNFVGTTTPPPQLLTASQKIGKAINIWLGAKEGDIKTLLYAEYELSPVEAGVAPPIYQVKPMLLWYPEAIHGENYKAVTITMRGDAVPKTDKPVFEITSIIGGKDGLPVGTLLGAKDLHGMQKTYFSGPPISAQNGNLITQQIAASSLKDTATQAFEIGESQFVIDLLEIELAKGKCIQEIEANKEIKDPEVKKTLKEFCESAANVTKQQKALIATNLERSKERKSDAVNKIEGTLSADGLVNISFKVNETTKPNKFLLALSKALSESKSDLNAPLSKIFLGPQNSNEDKIEKFTDQWNYQTKLVEHNNAKEAYELIVAQNPPASQEEIDAAYATYRTTGVTLGELAIKTGNQLPF